MTIKLRSRSRCLGVAIAIFLTPMAVLAWGEEGHRVVGAIADSRVTSAAQAQIHLLLAGEPEPTLAGISVWADQHKNPQTGRWHYTDFPAEDCSYQPERDCPGGQCLIGALQRYVVTLKNSSEAADQRTIALKMIVHLVGDAHQPLHAGFADDKGGNKYQVQWMGRGTNLHVLWDKGLIESIAPDEAGLIALAETFKNNTQVVKDLDPVHWIEESCRIVRTPGFYPSDRNVDVEYQQRWAGTAERQLELAGLRLAGTLNQILAAP